MRKALITKPHRQLLERLPLLRVLERLLSRLLDVRLRLPSQALIDPPSPSLEGM